MLLPQQLNVSILNLFKYCTFMIQFSTLVLITKSTFVEKYYIRSEYIWQDGFLFDFLQKKTADL